MVGINNITKINESSLLDIANITNQDPMAFFINVNHVIFGGWLYFLLLLTLWIILVLSLNQVRNQIGTNIMYSGALITVISFFIRAIYLVKDGVVMGLLTDFQLWIFPLITIIIATFIYATKKG